MIENEDANYKLVVKLPNPLKKALASMGRVSYTNAFRFGMKPRSEEARGYLVL